MAALGHFANDSEIKVCIQGGNTEMLLVFIFCSALSKTVLHIKTSCHINPTIFAPGIVEIIRGQPQVQLPHHQADSSQLSCQCVPTLETHQLLLHMAP